MSTETTKADVDLPARTEGTAANPPSVAVTSPAKQPVRKKKVLRLIIAMGVLAGLIVMSIPWIYGAFTTVSTDDAYVNSHVTFVSPRVAGQVTRVAVEDNNRVRKGEILVELDKQPYQVEVDIAQAAVVAAESDLSAARAKAQSIVGEARAARFKLDHAMEEVKNQAALLNAKIASLESQKATLEKAQGDFERAVTAQKAGAVSPDEFQARKQALAVAKARLEEALQAVYQIRVFLGLPARPEKGDDLAEIPSDLDQNFSSVREAQAELIRSASELGVTTSSFNLSPKEMIAEFLRRDATGDVDRIYQQLLTNAPVVKQAQAKLLQAQRNLDQAKLNLSYTTVYAEIDGVVTRRNVNPGNHLVAGQSVMAIRSLTDTWIDANFKETQLRALRIGQPVDIDVDMYGSHQIFKGRISGFTFGTGSTLALLPPENATGNYVKVVQRLPVRIELLDYDAEKTPLFTGLSVTPLVYIKETPTGPNAGQFLQPYAALNVATAPASR